MSRFQRLVFAPAWRAVAPLSMAALMVMLALGSALLAQQPTPPTTGPPASTPPPTVAAPPAAPAPSSPAQPTFRSGVNFVRVDATVTDKQGRPVGDLHATDFEVFEEGKPQTIETFRFVKIDTAVPVPSSTPIRTRADEERAAANEDARIFVFFLDDYHVRLGNSMGARRPLAEFIQHNLSPRDLVAVMYPLTPLDAVSLTRDHQSVIRTLEKFEGRKYDYEPRHAQEQRIAMYPAETVERIRRQVSLSALEGLAVKLGALREGRKAVIVVSEGYTAVLPPQLRDPVAAMPGMGNPARRNPMAGENSIAEERAELSGQLDVQQEMQDLFNAANRSNTAFYTVDPRGLATGEFDIDQNVGMQRSNASLRQTQDTLRVLAAETDGRAIVNRNDFGKAMQQIVTDSSAYYLIGYTSTTAPQDGKFHEIKVRVKRPGVEVRSRKGYWALSARDTARLTAPKPPPPATAVSRAVSGLAEPMRGRFVRTWFGTERGAEGKTRVTFVWESIPPEPGVRREVATSVSLTAASMGGETLFSSEQSAAAVAAPAAAPAAASATGLRQLQFDAPPGKLQLRIGVNGATGAIDSFDRELVVPDFSGERRLGTPRLYVARTARDAQAIRSDSSSVPTASREFRRTERLLVRIPTYPEGASPQTLSAKLLNRSGAKLADVPTTEAAGQPHLLELPLAALAPGEYVLEIAVTSHGQPPITDLIAFRVVG